VLVPQLRALYKQLSTLDEKFIPKLKKVFGSFAWITESDDTIILAKLFTFVPDVYDEPTKKKKPKGVVEQSTPEIKLPAE
jgi:hypothetical protein